jgi:Flp pilus assembly protein TadB
LPLARAGEKASEADRREEMMAVSERAEVKALREDARHMRESVRRENLEERLEGVVQERPGVQPFLEFRPLVVAVTIAAVLTLIAVLLTSPAVAAAVLVLSFGIAWVAMSRREYSQRRPTKEYSPEDDDSPGKGDKEVAPFSN